MGADATACSGAAAIPALPALPHPWPLTAVSKACSRMHSCAHPHPHITAVRARPEGRRVHARPRRQALPRMGEAACPARAPLCLRTCCAFAAAAAAGLAAGVSHSSASRHPSTAPLPRMKPMPGMAGSHPLPRLLPAPSPRILPAPAGGAPRPGALGRHLVGARARGRRTLGARQAALLPSLPHASTLLPGMHTSHIIHAFYTSYFTGSTWMRSRTFAQATCACPGPALNRRRPHRAFETTLPGRAPACPWGLGSSWWRQACGQQACSVSAVPERLQR